MCFLKKCKPKKQKSYIHRCSLPLSRKPNTDSSSAALLRQESTGYCPVAQRRFPAGNPFRPSDLSHVVTGCPLGRLLFRRRRLYHFFPAANFAIKKRVCQLLLWLFRRSERILPINFRHPTHKRLAAVSARFLSSAPCQNPKRPASAGCASP